MSYTVIRDTREQLGWSFAASASCAGTVDEKLPTGDYTLRGYEKLLCIERKGALAEFGKNIVQPRFDKELQRLTKFRYAFIICEFEIEDIFQWPQSTGLPDSVTSEFRINKFFILKKLIEYTVRYPTIRILFVGSRGRDVVSSIFKRVVECEQEAKT
jgi:hypothetical protein